VNAPLVIGIDPSLRSTGIAGLGWADTLRPRRRTGHARIAWLRDEIADRVKRADLVVIEGASHGNALQGGHHELAGLWWQITQSLWEAGIPYAVCPPVCRTIYALGTANPAKEYPRHIRARVTKGMVRDAVAERYEVECEGPGRYDKADALVLAHAGLDRLGYAAVELAASHRRALKTIRWPDLSGLMRPAAQGGDEGGEDADAVRSAA
jgi:porphobilinogen deaminase